MEHGIGNLLSNLLIPGIGTVIGLGIGSWIAVGLRETHATVSREDFESIERVSTTIVILGMLGGLLTGTVFQEIIMSANH